MIEIQKNIILAKYTTFQIGGAAKEFVAVKSKEEIAEAIKYAKEKNEEFVILGGGSNVLISDKGFDGLAVKISDNSCSISDITVECGVGLLLSELINLAKENNLSGLEWASGIPGTVGGAIRGNAGAYGSEIKNSVESIGVLNTENFKFKKYNKEDCNFSYRNSVFKQRKSLVILSSKFILKKLDKKEIIEKIKEINEKRAKRIPQNWKGSAGSFFENPIVKDQNLISEFEKETGINIQDKRIPAGWLIDRAGLSGKKIGNIMVSETNCNFIINTGGGTAEQTIILVSLIKQKVRDIFNVQLKEEIQYVGF